MRILSLMTVAVLIIPAPGMAQTQEGHQQHAESGIPALSAERVDDLLAGEGMGYALAAEMNSYPGPRHVLDLEAELDLGQDQVDAVNRIFEEMNERARALGSRLVEAERDLDELFRGGSAEAGEVEALVRSIGRLEAELRYTHLEAHLRTTELLTEEQIRRYDAERGHEHGHEMNHPH